MSLRNLPIAFKLRLMITSACVLVIALTCAAFVTYEWFSVRSGMVESYAIRAQILALNSTAALAFNNQADAEDVLQALKADQNSLLAVIYDAAGHPFAFYPKALRNPGPPAVAPGEHVFSGGRLTLAVPLELSGKPLGSLVIEESTARLRARLLFYALTALAFMILSSVVAYLLAGVLHRGLSGPILQLAATAHAVTDRADYGMRAGKIADDEIGALTDAFNAMLDRIQDHDRFLESRVAARTQDLQVANEELESYSYSVSHDLRGPLRSMAGRAEVALEEYGRQLPDEVKGNLNSILENARRLIRLIDELLEFARRGRQRPVPGPLNPGELVASVLAEFSGEIGARGVELEVAELPSCSADASMLRQLWVNLIANALKYTRGRAPARIEVGTMAVGEPDRVGYFVKDNGIGFDMEHAAKLFEPFQRLHNSSEFEGTGIGLATARRIVQRQGGRIWAEASPRAGATFFFTLPADRPGAGTARHPIPDEGP